MIPQPGALRRVVATCAGLPFILFLNTSYSIGANAQLIDCYRWDGTAVANNTRCPGSNACCGTGAVCLSNRLCTADSNPNSKAKPVRGPCAIQVWDDSCPQICMYNTGKRFPRVGTCPDGSLCCDDDPDCCEKGLGIFLDESGNQVSTKATAYITRYPLVAGGVSRYTLMPSPDVASTSTSTLLGAETSSDPPATITQADDVSETTPPTQPSAAPSSPNDSLGFKLGLGLGIPAAMLATAVVVYLWLRRRGYPAGSGAARGAAEAAPYQPASPAPGFGPGTEYGGALRMPQPMYRIVNPYPVEIGEQGPSELFVPSPGAHQHFPVPSTPKLQERRWEFQ
ncbi:uncharacterized protein B0H64DRAFT_416980 [Chaetomium fimeti]|uniref:Uncharacterized protein n=1 Tax=Chaetomium fimeti TaxID=1854472 RepID=A0AAE0HF14_9PEZI|nr:hypothetical protein B0H64DRAFT_416980 [Chaetomium fimeti]